MEKKLTKIDLKDKKILALLEKNTRLPASAIAKKVGLSKPSVSSRIERLVKSGIIDGFVIHVNFKALGLVNYRLYVKFENTPADFEQKLSAYLFSDGRVRWFSILQGEWDIVIRVLAGDIYEFREFEQGFFSSFGKYMRARTFAIIMNDAYHNCTYLTGNEGLNSDPKKDYSGSKTELTKEDSLVLFWLFQNSRMPFKELAGKAIMKPEAASYRLRKLEASGVITGYMAKINRAKIGYNEAKVLLWFQHATAPSLLRFRKYCESHPQVNFFGEIIGPWDMEVDLDVKDNSQLHSIMQEMRASFGDLIRDFSVLTKIREFEVNFMAKQAGIQKKV